MTPEQEFELYCEQRNKEYGSVKVNPEQFAKEMLEQYSEHNTRPPTNS